MIYAEELRTMAEKRKTEIEKEKTSKALDWINVHELELVGIAQNGLFSASFVLNDLDTEKLLDTDVISFIEMILNERGFDTKVCGHDNQFLKITW